MTYAALLKRITKMSPEQLTQPVKLMEGCSGNWTGITAVYVAKSDIFDDGREPGSTFDKEMRKCYKDAGAKYEPKPRVKKGHVFAVHDH